MGRKKSITTQQLMECIDRFHYERPEELIKTASLVQYLEANGFEVKDYTIRRDAKCREYMDKLNEAIKDKEFEFEKPIVYSTIDVDAFLERNSTRDRMKSALVERDRYYADVAGRAAKAIKQNRELRAEVAKYKETVSELMRNSEKLKEELADEQSKQKDEIIRTLKRILDDYIYPSMANAILEKEFGDRKLVEQLGRIITDEAVDAHLMLADSALPNCSKATEGSSETTGREESKFGSIARLRAGFEEK